MERNVANAATSRDNLIISRTKFGNWLTEICGYANPKDALPRAQMFNPPANGIRSWITVPHAETHEEYKLFLSANAGHTFQTIADRGFDLDVVLLKPSGTTSRLENMWSTAEPSKFNELVSVGTLAQLMSSEVADDLPF